MDGRISDRRHVFELDHASFSIDIPAPLDMKAVSPYDNLDPALLEQYKKMMGDKFKLSSNKLEDQNFQISAILGATEFGSVFLKDTTIACINNKKPNDPLEVKAEWWTLGSLRACAKYTWEYEFDSPTITREDLTGEVIVTFNYKKVQYRLEIGVRNLDQHEVKDVVMQMARSLRLEGEADEIGDPSPDKPKCRLLDDKFIGTGLSLGLDCQRNLNIRRDDFIVLGARARDMDSFNFICDAESDCPGGSQKGTIGLYSPVAITWKIKSGNASFVDVGCLPAGRKTAMGENVVLMPPPDLPAGASETIRIELKAVDAGDLNPTDSYQTQDVSVKVTRSASIEERYEVVITGAEWTPYRETLTETQGPGSCRAAIEFLPGTDLEKAPEIVLPEIADAGSLIHRERLILRAKHAPDKDKFALQCGHNSCGKDKKKEFEVVDEIVYEWQIESGGGHFEVGGEELQRCEGSAVVYRAPNRDADVSEVRISLKAKNRPGKLKDPDSPKREITLKVYQGAVVLNPLPPGWLPKAGEDLRIKANLAMLDRNDPTRLRPAFSHISALVNFQLNGVTNYPGICTNYDDANDPEADRLDLYLSKSALAQAFRCYDWARTDGDRARYAESRRLIKGRDTLFLPVSVRDYGGSANLELKHLNAAVYAYRGPEVYRIPEDNNENGIPDAAALHDQLPLNDDLDGRTLNIPEVNWGDGYVNFEEYRGFMTGKNFEVQTPQHVRTDPNERDLFISSGLDLTYDLFQRASKIKVHFVSLRLMNSEYVVNHLSPTDGVRKGGDQYGVRVEHDVVLPIRNWYGQGYDRSKPSPDDLGQTRVRSDFSESGAYLPSQVLKVIVDTSSVRRNRYNVEEVVAHELGHACGVNHHGDLGSEDLKVSHCVQARHLTNSTRCEKLQVMIPGTKYSGEMRCVMRYNWRAISAKPLNNLTLCDDDCIAPNGRGLTDMDIYFDEEAGWKPNGRVSAQLVKRDIFCRDNGPSSPYYTCQLGRGSCFFKLRVKCW